MPTFSLAHAFNRSRLVLLLVFGLARPGLAADLYSYDLDSLVYMSTDIVEVVVVGPTIKDDDIKNDVIKYYFPASREKTVAVRRVYSGSFKVGQTVSLADVDLYAIDGRSVRPGDELTLFLVPYKPRGDAAATGIYEPVPSGIKYHREGHVQDFFQNSNPGPYEALDFTRRRGPALTQFQTQVETSIAQVATWRSLLADKSAAANLPQWMALLRNRTPLDQHEALYPSDWWWQHDIIAGKCAHNIAALNDMEAATVGLAIKPHYSLVNALSNPKGYRYLLRAIANRERPFTERLALARVFPFVYSDGRYTAFPSPSLVGVDDGIVVQLVNLAFDLQHEPLISAAILNVLENIALRKGDSAPRLIDHIREALPRLRNYYKSTDSQIVLYSLETLLFSTGGMAEYKSLRSACGVFPSVVQTTAVRFGDKPTTRLLRYHIERRVLEPQPAGDREQVVLLHVASGKRYPLPRGEIKSGYDTGTRSTFTTEVELSADLPPGLYRLYPERYRAEKLISTGHYSELTL